MINHHNCITVAIFTFKSAVFKLIALFLILFLFPKARQSLKNIFKNHINVNTNTKIEIKQVLKLKL